MERRYRYSFTVEENQAFLAEQYPWALEEKKPMKIKVQAQHLQPGDVVGSGEVVIGVIRASVSLASNKIWLQLEKNGVIRQPCWGKYTMINVERVG